MRKYLLTITGIIFTLNVLSQVNTNVKNNNLDINETHNFVQNSTGFSYKEYLAPDLNGIIYVKEGATGDGSSWANATGDLQGAINEVGVQQVWVAEGYYYPTLYVEEGSVDPKMKSFIPKEGVQVYGNFIGTETSIEERDIKFFELGNANTILTTETSSYHILVFDTAGYAQETLFDGFYISGGNANNLANPPHNFGGGVVLSNNSKVQNCAIYENDGEIGAGAVLYKGGQISDCYIVQNDATHEGGGIAILYDGKVSNSRIFNNTSENRGAGIYLEGNTGEIENCFIQDNQSDDYGAGVYFRDIPGATIKGCYINNNVAGKSGGGIYAYNSLVDILNCTVTENIGATGYGGGLNSYNLSTVNIKNSIFTDNTAATGDNLYKCSSGCELNASYSGIEGGYNGETNVSVTANDFTVDYYLYDGVDDVNPPSQCVNSGDNSIIEDNAMDIDGNPRIAFTKVDMGAFESTTCKSYHFTGEVTTDGAIVTPTDTNVYFNNSLVYNIFPNTNAQVDAALYNSVDVTSKLIELENNYTFSVDTINVNGAFSISFIILPDIDITASASEGGTISPTTATVEYGGSQVFTITPNTSYEFDEASFSGEGNITNNDDGTITLSNITTTGELSVIFKLASGIYNLSNTKLKIYPNPAYDNIKIQIPENKSICKLKIVNIGGITVHEDYYHGQELHIGNLNSGIYYIILETDEKNYVSKFMKK